MKMNKLDKNIVYEVFCTKLLLKYLNSKDKTEFSSSCKFIYQKCAKFRLLVYKPKSSEFNKCTKIIKLQLKSAEQADNIQLDHINKIINEYKPYLLSLICTENHNYYTLQYLSMNLNSLASLHLSKICIPMKSFKTIIKNLPNLQILGLSHVGIALKENKSALSKLKFPKCLTKLSITSCFQFNCESFNPPNMGSVTKNYIKGKNLDISNITINNLRCLDWFSGYKESVNTLNQLLANNNNLETLEVHLGRLNSESLSIISNNRNLTKLIIFCEKSIMLNNGRFPKLKFIKSLELKSVFLSGFETVKQLFQNCPNLEEIKYNMIWGCELGLHVNMHRFKKLKKLSIVHSDLVFLLSLPFPNSPVEHLEFTSHSPFKVGFRIFDNLKHLKRVTINGLSPNFMNHDYNRQMLDSSYKWIEINYSNSVQFWKIIETDEEKYSNLFNLIIVITIIIILMLLNFIL